MRIKFKPIELLAYFVFIADVLVCFSLYFIPFFTF